MRNNLALNIYDIVSFPLTSINPLDNWKLNQDEETFLKTSFGNFKVVINDKLPDNVFIINNQLFSL